MTPIPLTPKPSGSILHLGSYLRPSPSATARERRSDFSAGGLSSCKRNILNECFFTPPLPGTINHNNMDSSTSSNAQQQQAASFATPASAKLQQHQQHQLQMQQQAPPQQQPLEPFQQYSLLRGQANGGDADLVGVLRQVSEMTMNNTPRKLPTPQSGNNNNNLPICETPDQKLLHVGFTPDPHYRYHHRQFSGGSKLVFPPNNNGNGHNGNACDSKRKPSPMYHGRKKVRSMATTATADSRVFNAPPLPSSPELSVGGRTSRHSAALPPQFSPIASLRMDANATQAESTEAADNDRPSDLAMALPDLPPPDLPPPPPPTPATATETTEPLAPRSVNGSSNSQQEAPPPAMPWMDTPEQQTGRKRLVSLNQLKMRKRNLNNNNNHSLSHSLPFNG